MSSLGPTYLAAHPGIVRPSDLGAHTVIGHRAARETWPFRSRAGSVVEVEVRALCVVPEPDVARTMLIAGAGVGILPDLHASEAIADGSLVRVLPDHEHRSVDVRALYASHRSLSAKVRVFLGALAAQSPADGPGFDAARPRRPEPMGGG